MRLFEKRADVKWETISQLTDAYRQLFPSRPKPTKPATASYRGGKITLDLSATEKKAMTLALQSATPYEEAATAWLKVLQLLRKRGVSFKGDY
jgi:hypothetical protein